MKITRNTARELLAVLDDLKEKLSQEEKAKYPYSEWEKRREKVKERLANIPEYIEKAANMVQVEEQKTGRPRTMTLVQKVTLIIFARMMDKSNRDVENILAVAGSFFGFRVSYKTVERLYSDKAVKAALHNLFILLLREEGTSGNYSSDGTGYSISVTKHYRNSPKKRSKDFVFASRIIDLKTGMYVGVGYSNQSEMDAFKKAMLMLKELGVKIDSIRLDKYYSSCKVLKIFGKDVAVFAIPKKNISKLGFSWVRIIRRILKSPVLFLKEYRKRNLSETGFSADKPRFGWKIHQVKEDRRETALFSIALLHNIFSVRVNKT